MLGNTRRQKLQPSNALTGAYTRSFKGGLNTLDSPLNLSSQYITEGVNVYPDPSGSLRVRYGTSRFASLSSVGDRIIGMEYYIDRLICVFADGRLAAVDSAGVVTPIWNTAIAATRSGAPAAWGATVFASFTQFGGKLIVCNGRDKPLIVDSITGQPVVNYLADVGSGSNVNVPRAKYCITHNNYLILAVTPTDKTKLYISSKGTSGTFFGDPPPNDSVTFDLATHLMRGLPEITGIGSFRDKLVVTFDEIMMTVSLGVYNGTTHVPEVDDVVENHGSVSHRCIVPMGDDMLFMDKVGIASVARALITATLSPTRESSLVGRDIQKALSRFSVAQLSDEVFALHDRIASQVLFFIPQQPVVPGLVLTESFLEVNSSGSTSVVLSENSRTHSAPVAGVGGTGVARSTQVASGKMYFQVECSTLGANGSTSVGISTCIGDQQFYGNGTQSAMYLRDGTIRIGASTTVASGLPSINNKTVDIAYDSIAKRIWFRTMNDDGTGVSTWNNSGTADPATGVGGYDCAAVATVPMRAISLTYDSDATSQFRYNFGQRAFVGPGVPAGYSVWGYSATSGGVPTAADNDVYVFCVDKSQRFRAMAYYNNMPYRCGCRSSDGRLFVAAGQQIWYYRNQFEPLHVDDAYTASQSWNDDTLWDDRTGWIEPGLGGTFDGSPIRFTLSTPWSDMREPEKQKDARYLHAVMEGSGLFDVEMYTDRFTQRQLSMQFRMTPEPALPTADTRPMNHDQLYAWNAKFTRARLRVVGETKQGLRVLSLGLLYLPGGYRR